MSENNRFNLQLKVINSLLVYIKIIRYFECQHLLYALQKVTDTDWESNQNNQDWNKDDLKVQYNYYHHHDHSTRVMGT